MKTIKMEARYWNIGFLHTELPVTADTVLKISKAFGLLPAQKVVNAHNYAFPG